VGPGRAGGRDGRPLAARRLSARGPRTVIIGAGAAARALRYLAALRVGQKRVAAARDYLLAIAGEGALPALALRDTTDEGSWEPVGEETLYSFVEDAPGFVLEGGGGCLLALVDSEGMAKAVAQNIGPEKRRRAEEALEADGVREYMGEVRLPV